MKPCILYNYLMHFLFHFIEDCNCNCNYLVVDIVPAAAVIALAAVLVIIAFVIRRVHKQRNKHENEGGLELHSRENGAAPGDSSNERGAVESDGASGSSMEEEVHSKSPVEKITVGPPHVEVKFRERLSSRLSLTRRPSNPPGDDEEGLLPKNHNNY